MRLAFNQMRAWWRAASLHKHHLARRAMAGLMRCTTQAWTYEAEAEAHWRERLLRRCLQEWQRVAYEQVRRLTYLYVCSAER